MKPIRTSRPRERIVLGPLALLLFSAWACGGVGAPLEEAALPPSDPAELDFAPELDVDLDAFERTRSGLYVQDVQLGDGPIARRTSRVWIRYVGWLPDGTVFDGNIGGDPYHLRLGGNEVIRGWDEGIEGMKRGGIRKLVIPPGLAYGSRGSGGNVPPGATLVFLVELIDVG
jgi:FKBP-type peptidyl-prolyl cis-trans isomerase FkpA